MANPDILTGFTAYRDGDLDRKAQIILLSLTDNPHFPSPNPPLSSLQTAISQFNEALIRAKNGSRQDTFRKNEKREVLEGMLNNLAAYVRYLGQNDPLILMSSGYTLLKPRRRTGALDQLENFQVVPGAASGTLLVSFAPMPGARGYVVEWTDSPVTSDSIWNTTFTTRSECLLDDLEPGKPYVIRSAAVGSDPMRNYTHTITRFVS